MQGPHFQAGSRIAMLRARRMDPIGRMTINASGANEVYDRISDPSEAIKYAIGSMQPIDDAYTKSTYEEAERVKQQLQENLPRYRQCCEFDYQGSVTNNTHIVARSDIDLLTLHSNFISVEPPQKVETPYVGNPVNDLLLLRAASAVILKEKFPNATVDDSGSKSVSIEGGSLRRKVDVVSSNWRDTTAYFQTGMKRDRAIEVLDSRELKRIKNLPFLHNERIHNKDSVTLGGLRRVIRLLKSIRYDSPRKVNISSYDIASVVYGMDNCRLIVSNGMELILMHNCKVYLDTLATSQTLRDSLDVPNMMRKVFCKEGACLDGLNDLRRELDLLLGEIERDLTQSRRRLLETRMIYT
jgi:hypothetical protein